MNPETAGQNTYEQKLLITFRKNILPRRQKVLFLHI
jgi:hypothetical protein